MKRDSLTSFSKEELIALIGALTKQIGVLTKRVEALEAELGKPPKTPDNSSVPRARGTRPMAKARRSRRPSPMPGPWCTKRGRWFRRSLGREYGVSFSHYLDD